MTIVIVIYNKEKLGSGVCVVVDMMILFFSYSLEKPEQEKQSHQCCHQKNKEYG